MQLSAKNQGEEASAYDAAAQECLSKEIWEVTTAAPNPLASSRFSGTAEERSWPGGFPLAAIPSARAISAAPSYLSSLIALEMLIRFIHIGIGIGVGIGIAFGFGLDQE